MVAAGLDIVICTYNNAASLDRVLEALGRQHSAQDLDWGVLVVENNCSDRTPEVLARHLRERRVPLRVVHEREQGLTPARRRGVLETSRDWIAFVDDDCLVAEDWIEQVARSVREQPGAGAIGGRVTPDWEGGGSALVRSFGWAFAQQDGDALQRVQSLAGAGLVVRRGALAQTGWIERQLLADRVGGKLVSGGDVEITLRLAAQFQLWYDPRVSLRHAIPRRRTSKRHLAALLYGLGRSKFLGDCMLWPGSYGRRLRRAVAELGPITRDARWYARTGGAAAGALMLCFLLGWVSGASRLVRMPRREREELLGAAAAVSSEPGPARPPAAATSPDRGR